MKALSSRYAVRVFRFASNTDRVGAARDLSFDGTQTKLGEALQRAKDEFTGLPLAGLVMVTDGADTEESSIQESLLGLRASQIPVFTVGIGRETLGRDIQISRVSTPRKVLKGTNLSVDVIVSQSGFRGTTVPLNVEDSGRILSSQEIALTNDGEPTTVKVHFTANEAGARTIRFRIPPQQGEEITQNNVREVLLDVQDRKEKILFFDGEPHFEVKFIRRAVADDPNLQLVVLQRTTDTKFFRILIDSPDELAAGFPKTRDELFSYRGLILGSIEANAFSGDQLRMIADFADRRGGGLMMIGGRRSFAEGGYAGTPVADALPVVLESKQPDTTSRIQVTPTRAGQSHAVTQIEKTEQESVKRWAELPPVISVNPIRQVKPGATALLRGVDENGRESIALAYQRYGRGKTLAFPIYDSWTWQMDAKIAVEDMTHETYWRQLMRWLVDGVPDQVELTTTPDQVEAGEAGHAHRRGVRPQFPGSERRRRQRARHRAERGRHRRAAAVDRRAQRRVPRHVRAGRERHVRGAHRRVARRHDARRNRPDRARARRAERQRVFRRGDARAAAAPHLGGNRRRLLHAPDRVDARRRHEIHGTRRDDRGRARLVGHADRAVPAAHGDARRVELSAEFGIWHRRRR